MNVSVFTMTVFAVEPTANDIHSPLIDSITMVLMEGTQDIHHLEFAFAAQFTRQNQPQFAQLLYMSVVI
jgi:hypothetical protein